MKKILLSIIAILGIVIINAQIVNIPDANFKAYLVGNTSINTNGDTEIQLSEANSFTGAIQAWSSNISNLTGIEAFTSAYFINFANNNVSSVDLSANVALEVLECNGNQLSSIDVSNNTLLRVFACHTNNLTSIDVSNNPGLTNLDCQMNSITSIDASNNTSLYGMNLRDNNLNTLNIANGNNTNYGYFAADGNPNLYCIQVDDSTYSADNWTSIDAQSYYSETCTPSCIVNIPDANFKSALIGNPNINTNGDNEIQCSEASAFGDTLDLNQLNISDLTGLEQFVSIVGFIYRSNLNPVSTIDLTNNVDLQYVDCSFNTQLTDLNLTNCSQLKTLLVQRIGANSIDLTNNNLLTKLFLESDNPFSSSIDLSNNDLLDTLLLRNIEITSVDLSDKPNLKYLDLTLTEISNLDLTNNPEIHTLFLNYTLITTVDLSNQQKLGSLEADLMPNLASLDVSTCDSLWKIFARYNSNLVSLDLSQNANLDFVSVRGDSILSVLNLKNGFNTDLVNVWIKNNPLLTCVEVDDSTYSINNWTNIDSTFNFSENCNFSNPILVSSITVQGQNGLSTITTNGGTLQMEAVVLPTNADDASYTWSVINGTGSATISSSGLLTASADGTVDVIATANDASGATGSKTITISNQSVGIQDLSFSNLNVYPNPTTGIVNIDVNNEEIYSLRIIDLSGRIVMQFAAETQINVSHLNPGIYLLEVSNEEKSSRIKLIVR